LSSYRGPVVVVVDNVVISLSGIDTILVFVLSVVQSSSSCHLLLLLRPQLTDIDARPWHTLVIGCQRYPLELPSRANMAMKMVMITMTTASNSRMRFSLSRRPIRRGGAFMAVMVRAV
jgi:hypothetical protein